MTIKKFIQLATICSIKKRVLPKPGMPNIVSLHEGELKQHIHSGSTLLEDGAVIALPTDTLYGLAALVQHSDALKEIYRIKQRNTLKPLAVCVAKVNDIYKWANVTVSRALLCDLLPGPVTLIFTRTRELNLDFNPDTHLVGIRIPDCDFIRSVALKCASPIALTSANISNHKSPLNIEEFSDIWTELSCVFDGGNICDTFRINRRVDSCSSVNTEFVRQGSTIIDLSVRSRYRVVREGVALQQTKLVLSKYQLVEQNF